MDDTLTIPLPGGTPLELILVPAGHFKMGSEAEEAFDDEKPEHIVHIKEPFYIGKYLVTQAQWEAVMGNNPARFPGAHRPAEQVSWLDIVAGDQEDDGNPAFLDQINSMLPKARPDLATSHRFKLPTEAEWEYAAKGGPRFNLETLRGKKVAELYPTYVGSDQLESCGWFDKNSNYETKPVGLKQANELGLYDMSGNVYEWCEDWFDGDIYQAREGRVSENPVGADSGGGRVVRGGGSWGIARYCRSSYRGLNRPSNRYVSVGFRLVLSPSSGSGTSG